MLCGTIVKGVWISSADAKLGYGWKVPVHHEIFFYFVFFRASAQLKRDFFRAVIVLISSAQLWLVSPGVIFKYHLPNLK